MVALTFGGWVPQNPSDPPPPLLNNVVHVRQPPHSPAAPHAPAPTVPIPLSPNSRRPPQTLPPFQHRPLLAGLATQTHVTKAGLDGSPTTFGQGRCMRKLCITLLSHHHCPADPFWLPPFQKAPQCPTHMTCGALHCLLKPECPPCTLTLFSAAHRVIDG